jgi:hypothetical protein
MVRRYCGVSGTFGRELGGFEVSRDKKLGRHCLDHAFPSEGEQQENEI